MSNRFVACGIAAFSLLIAVIASIPVVTSMLRILLLNSGDPQSSLAHFLNSDLQGSPKFTRAQIYQNNFTNHSD